MRSKASRAQLVLACAALGFASSHLAAPVLAADKARGFKPSSTWLDIGRLCRRSARAPATPIALEIGRLARDEYYRFGGHRIDATGRLFSFGVVESEQEEDAQNIEDGQYRLRHLGWWNVLGYWAKLGESKSVIEAAREFLRLKGYKDAASKLEDDDTTPLPPLRIAAALDALERSFASLPAGLPAEIERRKALKEILTEALIRAAANDVAWSAAFISSIMRMARLEPDRFQYSDSHQAYIHKAVDTSAADLGGAAATHLYRACPPDQAALRVGDMVCYHRVKKLGGVSRAELREMALEDRDKPAHERRIRASHCDIVAHINPRTRVAYVVGGNVQQSVTVKQLVLRRQGRGQPGLTLVEDQPGSCRGGISWTLPPPSPGTPKAPHLSDECSLNRKGWFVVLQAR